jgi:hypothetical protein
MPALSTHTFTGFVNILDQPPIIGRLKFAFFRGWQSHKHSQWMILHRSFISLLRSSPTMGYIVAHAEWTHIPDESVFATILLNAHKFGYSVVTVNDSKRYLVFPKGSHHPNWITESDWRGLKTAMDEGKMFTRKIDVVKEHRLVALIDRHRT